MSFRILYVIIYNITAIAVILTDTAKTNNDKESLITSDVMPYQTNRRERVGPTMEKVLLLIGTGVALSITARPDHFFKIIKASQKEWQRITAHSLRYAIRKLYQSKLVDCREKQDGTVKMVLTEKGRKKILEFNLDTMEIKNPKHWDGLWRFIIFDIPEYKKKARDALAFRLKSLGVVPMQKSVFVHPYDCKNEIEFLVELFDLRPFVRFVVAKEVDTELHLKKKFKLI